jgi:hypothetical protein
MYIHIAIIASLLRFPWLAKLARKMISGLYCKHIMIANDNSVMRIQVVASPTVVVLITLEVSFMLLANIYSRGITHDDRHVIIVKYL